MEPKSDEASVVDKGEKVFAVSEVAFTTGLTENTVRNMLKAGTLKGRKLGKMWRVTKSEIERYLKNGPRTGRDVVDNNV